MAETPSEEVMRDASSVAAEIMGNDHLVHRLDEQQQDEVHGDIQIAVLRALSTAEARGRQKQREVAIADAKALASVDKAERPQNLPSANAGEPFSITMAVAAERERCARIAEANGQRIAAAIRNQGQTCPYPRGKQ